LPKGSTRVYKEPAYKPGPGRGKKGSSKSEPPLNIKDSAFTQPTPAMPDEYKVVGDSIQSYKNYYNGAKRYLFNWKNRAIPYFVEEDYI